MKCVGSTSSWIEDGGADALQIDAGAVKIRKSDRDRTERIRRAGGTKPTMRDRAVSFAIARRRRDMLLTLRNFEALRSVPVPPWCRLWNTLAWCSSQRTEMAPA